MHHVLLFWLSVLSAMAGTTPVELGTVQWLRDLDQGREQSQATGRPVLILFQEVPGCSTCRSYGEKIFSHPLIVEAVEDLFVPVAVFNNRGERTRPPWNNFVSRPGTIRWSASSTETAGRWPSA